MISKRHTTGASFHRVRETVTLTCLNPPASRNYSLFRRAKDEVLVNLRKRTGSNRKIIFFESIGTDLRGELKRLNPAPRTTH